MHNLQLMLKMGVLALVVMLAAFGVPQMASADGPVVHVVRYGETLTAIGQRYRVSLSTLFKLNRISSSGLIVPGQRIVVAPAPAAKPPAALIRLSGVPLMRQNQRLTCEEAAAAMASRGRISEAQLLRVMPRSANPFEGIRGRTNGPIWGSLVDYGAYAQAIQIGLSRLGVGSQVYYGRPYEEFKGAVIAQLKAGRPIVWWTTYLQQRQTPVAVRLPNGSSVKLVRFEHAVTIVGMTAGGFIYYDPLDGSVRTVAFADHQRASSYFGNMALVITD